jgi:hypothetical protein
LFYQVLKNIGINGQKIRKYKQGHRRSQQTDTYDLKTRNHELTAELNKMRHAKKSPEECYEAARLRDQKHLRRINKFKTAGYYVLIGGILALLSSSLLFAQISIRYAGQYEWTNVTLNYYLGESSHRFGDPRIGSMAIGSPWSNYVNRWSNDLSLG